MAPSTRRRGGLRRAVTNRAVRKALLVFVEGLRTEADYLVAWRRVFRDSVVVTVDPFRGGPLQLVERAVAVAAAERRDEKRGRGRAYDEVWCVFDRDEHPNFDVALEKADLNAIGVAFSNPCLEIWFVLNFQDQAAYLGRSAAQARSRAHLGCDKALTQAARVALIERYPSAVIRAKALDAKHAGDGSPPGTNPSSSVWRLIESLRATQSS